MSWFKRVKEGITTKSKEKKYVPDGLWNKCPKCKTITSTKDLVANAQVCPACQYHFKIDSESYFSILCDEAKYKELYSDIESGDPLQFTDTKSYVDRVRDSQKKSGLKDALRVATGKLNGMKIVVSCMDFGFIGGSMGSVVGEKIALSIDYAREQKVPLIIISISGGARMMEAAFSLMQMAKTSAALYKFDELGGLFISVMTHPTTGGVAASFASLGDIHIAEMSSLIGFAGPRVIKQTIQQELPEGFQTSKFQLEHGQVDLVIHRQEMKKTLYHILKLHQGGIYESI
jgi:acetyl-CoA carboxylase carboxyl transferase subunit beta